MMMIWRWKQFYWRKMNETVQNNSLTLEDIPSKPEEEEYNMKQSLGLSTPSVSWLDKIITLLMKMPESRTIKETEMLVEYGKESKAFATIIEKVSPYFFKCLINTKAKEILQLKPGTIVCKQGELTTHFYFLIDGKLSSTEPNKAVPDIEEIFEKLGLEASHEVKEINRLKRRNQWPPKAQEKKYVKISEKQSADLALADAQKHACGIEDRTLGRKYISTVITRQQSRILAIPESDFLTSLHLAMDDKVRRFKQNIQYMQCFKGQENQKIQTFILSLSQRKRRRGDIIYRQNDPSDSIYFLTKGEIKLNKCSNLFVENPNNLHGNRLRLLDIQSELKAGSKPLPRYKIEENQSKKNESILAYADLSTMFNYHPMKKDIQICRMEAFCMFGEEEMIERKPRDTTATCNSIQVTYYEITLKRIMQIFGQKSMPNFIRGLREATKTKVLRRQQYYANSIHFSNQANMKYFYYDGEKQAASSKNFRITKVNKILENNKNSVTLTPRPDPLLKKRSTSSDNTDSLFLTSPSPQKSHQTNPLFTTFNFNKLRHGTSVMGSRVSQRLSRVDNREVANNSLEKLIKKRDSLVGLDDLKAANPEQKQAAHSQNILKHQDDDDDDIGDEYLNTRPTDEELKIIRMTHTWKLIKKKVDTQLTKSYKMSPKKYTIDVQEPLIENKFLMDMDKQKIRVERKLRKEKINLGSSKFSIASRRTSFNLS